MMEGAAEPRLPVILRGRPRSEEARTNTHNGTQWFARFHSPPPRDAPRSREGRKLYDSGSSGGVGTEAAFFKVCSYSINLSSLEKFTVSSPAEAGGWRRSGATGHIHTSNLIRCCAYKLYGSTKQIFHINRVINIIPFQPVIHAKKGENEGSPHYLADQERELL
ncbi:hypothetical protein E2C01_029901 [Portunus trituberculatus]|uniref:Uncharacterized protein n=1 Tax=Portunus trituberculatus TaxID=210409 RepID=A0A5B7EU76_PORTR|nr:hypothetical protein [Portunus trituberculatus]